MGAARFGKKIDGHVITPGSFNRWIQAHNGYDRLDNIEWTTVEQMGLRNKVFSRNIVEISDAVCGTEQTFVVVQFWVDTETGSQNHWALVTGVTDDGKLFLNDPGRDREPLSLDDATNVAIVEVGLH